MFLDGASNQLGFRRICAVMNDSPRISILGIHLKKVGGPIFVHHCPNRTGLLEMIADIKGPRVFRHAK